MFGPNKVNLDAWRAAQIWSDRSRCIVSMKKMMYGGGTFPDSQISEAGRQLLARQLTALTDEQMTALFAAARFREFYEGRGRAADVHEWVDALRDKIGQIADGPACPD